MKNKTIYINKLISSIFITLLLIYFLIITPNRKLIFIPFLLCSISNIGKNVCMLLDKKKFANIFHKLFIISFLTFWFGILAFGSYLFVKEHNYFSLLFTIPFWLVGIYIVRKSFFDIKKKKVEKNKMSKFNFKIIVSCFLVLSVLIIGIICLFVGIHNTYKLNEKTKNYMITDGYLKDYHIYNIDEDGTTYQLIYTYQVDEKEYTITTDYGVGYIPESNSIRKVKYNPNNPSEAILVGTNSSNFLIYFGAFFTLGGMVFVLAVLHIKGVFDKFKFDVIGAYIGIVFFIVGIGIIVLQNGTSSSFIETIKSMGLWFLIPIMFIIVGGVQTIKCLFFKRAK